MHRLTQESRFRLEKVLDYTPEQIEIIYGLKKARLLGVTMDIDPSYFASKEGIARQLDKFTLPDGLIHYFIMNNNVPDLQRMCVSIDIENFK